MNAPSSRFAAAGRAAPAEVADVGLAVSQFRLMVIMLMFMLATAVIGARLAWMLVFESGDRGRAAAAAGPRGDILDRNGQPLAMTIEAWSVAIFPRKVLSDRVHLARDLARLMPERDEAAYLRILSSGRTFVELRKRATPALIRAVNALGEPGLDFPRETQRLYPQAGLAGHVLGYRQDTEHGLTGIGVERFFDAELKAGRPLALTIDGRVQAALDGEITRRMMETRAVGGAGVILDVDTGEVMAMSSQPSINPNAPLRVPEDVPNKMTLSTYELGSTFKMLTFANALEHGVLGDMAQTIQVSAPLRVGGYTINDDHPMHRALTVPEVMTYSSNIGTARIADALGEARTKAFFAKLGLDRTTGIELRERGRPQLPGYWARTTVMTAAYGHGIAVTPLHLAQAYAALVNGGILRQATLVKRPAGAAAPGTRVITEATSARMRQLMRLVVLQGTGSNADAPGLRVGGKTGTAEKVAGRGYDKNANITTFAAAFPMDRPRYVVLVLLDDAKPTKDSYGWKTAGWMAAPLAKRVIARVGPLLGVTPEEGRDIDLSDMMPLILEKKVPGKNAVE